MNGTLAPLFTTLAIQMMSTLSMLAVPVLATTAAADVGVSATYVGLFVAIISLAAMFSSVVGSAMVLRFGAIRLSQFCLLLCAMGLATTMLAAPSALVLGAILIGLGGGPITPASSHILAKNTPPHLIGLVFSLKQTGVPLGGAVAGVLVPPLVVAAGWRVALAVVALICLAVAMLAQSVRGALDADREPQRRMSFVLALAPLKMVLSIAPIRALAFASLFYASMQGCLTGYLVTYLVSSLGLSLIQAGVTMAAAQAGGIVGRIIWGTIADRWIVPNRMFGILGLMMTAGAGLTASFSSAWSTPELLAVCALFGASALGWNGVHLAQVARLAPVGKAGPATGGSVFFFFFGVVAGPPLFGAIVGAGFGYPAAFLVLSLPTLAIGLHFTFSRAKAVLSQTTEQA